MGAGDLQILHRVSSLLSFRERLRPDVLDVVILVLQSGTVASIQASVAHRGRALRLSLFVPDDVIADRLQLFRPGEHGKVRRFQIDAFAIYRSLANDTLNGSDASIAKVIAIEGRKTSQYPNFPRKPRCNPMQR